jgi:methionyl-tRNA synthetase
VALAKCRSIATPGSAGTASSDATTPISPTTRRPRQSHRVDDRPLPRRRATQAAGERRLAASRGLVRHLRAYAEAIEGNLFPCAGRALEFVGGANKVVDAEQPWTLAKAAKDGDEAAERLRGVLGDLLETCRLVGLAGAPVMPGAAPRILAQLGFDYPYGPDGNGGPDLLDELIWGAHADEPGRVAAPEPLFPRLESESGEA